MDEIVATIKRKRELAALEDSFVLERVQKILKQNKKIRKKIESSKSFKEFSRGSDFKELKRLVREELRKVYGVFDKDEKKVRKKLLNDLKRKPKDESIIKRILETHQSSLERINEYELVYKRIREYVGNPENVLDLGCGANPYSYLMLSRGAEYLAVDLPSEDLDEIAEFFTITGIKGKTAGIDLVNHHDELAREKADVALLFKVLDSLEEGKRHISNKVLDSLDVTWLVVSFPTMSIGGGKHIKKERRAWFEKLLARRGWYYETFSISNEVFYVVLKDADALAEKRYGKRTEEDLLTYEQYNFEKEGEQLKKYVPKGKVLDHGCGVGRDVAMLMEKGFEVTGIDRAKNLVTVAKKKTPEARLITGTILALPFKDEEFDAIWSIASLVHLYDHEMLIALEEMHRVLKKKGVLFTSVKKGTDRLDERQGVKLFFRQFTEEKIRSFLEKTGFEILELQTKERQKNNEGRKGLFFMIWARKKK